MNYESTPVEVTTLEGDKHTTWKLVVFADMCEPC